MLSVKERIDEVKKRMDEILREYRAGPSPAIFALRDEALSLLRPRQLLRNQTVPSRYVAVHPRNRYGDGTVPGHVHTLIDRFTEHGFSSQGVGVPLATEVPTPSHARRQEVVAFNSKTVQDSMGALPPRAWQAGA